MFFATTGLPKPRPLEAGFTLIELSIVLVIIGLIIGGVLVGQDLIRAAYVRAQISQIERFNAAVNTFYGKYQALPGDLNGSVAQMYGFAARGSGQGQGDGNGLIEGTNCWGAPYNLPTPGFNQGDGETLMFWVDLTYANGLNLNLIEGNFQSASPAGAIAGPYCSGNSSPAPYMPAAKIGGGDYIYVYSGGWSGTDGKNYYGLSNVATPGAAGWALATNGNPGVTVAQAYNIDRKIDDGYPQSGNVLAMYPGWGPGGWAVGGNVTTGGAWSPAGDHDGGGGPVVAGDGVASPASINTCYDNGNSAGVTEAYSMKINGGAGLNCALSFKMQGGD